MAYTHKKSSRIVTEEQFSDQTTIDGDRLDSAYEDLVDRINDVPKGDIRTRFVPQQYVFGYSPNGFPKYVYYGDYWEAAADARNVPGHVKEDALIRSQTRFPWTFIVNNQNTTADPQPRAPDPIPDDYDYPAENYQNRNRYKGTHIDSAHLGKTVTTATALPSTSTSDVDQQLNTGAWANSQWRQSFAGEITAYTNVAPRETNQFWPRMDNHYQMAWSHAWEFSSPVILDDLSLFFRIDAQSAQTYTATFKNDASTAVDQCVIQITVDSPLAPHKREYNSIVVMRHQVDFSHNKLHPTKDPSLNDLVGQLYDMMPQMDQGTAGATKPSRNLVGRMERLQNLNIPLPAGARVRLAIIIPWFAAQSVSTPVSGTDYYSSHWPETNSSRTPRADYVNQYGWAKERWESMMDWSLNGCLTVLSEIKS